MTFNPDFTQSVLLVVFGIQFGLGFLAGRVTRKDTDRDERTTDSVPALARLSDMGSPERDDDSKDVEGIIAEDR